MHLTGWLERRQVSRDFVIRHVGPVSLPLDLLVLDEALEHRIAQSVAYEFTVLGDGYGLPEVSGKRLDVSFLAFLGAQIENVGLGGRRKLRFLLDTVQSRRQHHAE